METSSVTILEYDGADDGMLPGLLAVRLSHPERLAAVEGAGGEAGQYDQAMLERDVWMVTLDESRHLLLAVDTAGEVVGYADYLDAHPRDGLPVLGVVEVHADRQRLGIGRALVDAVTKRLPPGSTVLRCSTVPQRDPAGFLTAVGFHPVPDAPAGLMERAVPR